MSTAEIKSISIEIEALQKQFAEAVFKTYPIGAGVIYEFRSGHHFRGVVIAHGYDGRVRIRNTVTGNLRWVEGASIFLRPISSPKAVKT